MSIKNEQQLKDKIKNLSKGDSNKFQTYLRIFLWKNY